MAIFQKFKTKSKFENFLIIAILTSIFVLIFSCIKYIYFGSNNWDEINDIYGIKLHLNCASDVISGKPVNYKDIYSNLEWYRIGLNFTYAFPMLILKNFFNQEDNKLLLFLSLRGFALFIYLSLGIILYFTSNYYQEKRSKVLALIFFSFPLLSGESYLNIKDIPFAICIS